MLGLDTRCYQALAKQILSFKSCLIRLVLETAKKKKNSYLQIYLKLKKELSKKKSISMGPRSKIVQRKQKKKYQVVNWLRRCFGIGPTALKLEFLVELYIFIRKTTQRDFITLLNRQPFSCTRYHPFVSATQVRLESILL